MSLFSQSGCCVVLATTLFSAACATSDQVNAPASRQGNAATLPNPASQNCVQRGGIHSVERNPSGGEYGVCVFPENRQCDEWALLRGECPIGGIPLTGYITPEARYCAIRGGKYSVTANSGGAQEKGSCALPGGRVCDAREFYTGACNGEKR